MDSKYIIESKKANKKYNIAIITLIVMLAILKIFAPVRVYASSIDDLDDRAGTEAIAGITWDEINEMSINNPNSLGPVQGLVLWMFAIIAFLKLAQKLDNLLQSLGLNVTQTGGRAIGDLIMAGMALRHVGGAISKGMGALGFGRKGGSSGGGSPSGGGTGTGGMPSGGSPIPSSSPSGSPGRSLFGGSASFPTAGSRSSNGVPAPAGGSPSSGSASTSIGGIPSGSPSGTSFGTSFGTSASGSTPTSTPTSTSTSGISGRNPSDGSAETPNTTPSKSHGRNPIGKATDWMRQEGFAQGAIKAGAKGGIIGLGIYSTKAGVSAVGSAVSARFGGRVDSGLGSNYSRGTYAVDGDIGGSNSSQQSFVNNTVGASNADNNADVGNIDGGSAYSRTYADENPENFRLSQPLHGSVDHTEEYGSTPTDFSSEEYHDARPLEGETDMNRVPAHDNPHDYNDYNHIGHHEGVASTNPISASDDIEVGSGEGDWNHSDYADSSEGVLISSNQPLGVYADEELGDRAWRNSNPVDNPTINGTSLNDTPQPNMLPSSINNAPWHNPNNPSDSAVATTATSEGGKKPSSVSLPTHPPASPYATPQTLSNQSTPSENLQPTQSSRVVTSSPTQLVTTGERQGFSGSNGETSVASSQRIVSSYSTSGTPRSSQPTTHTTQSPQAQTQSAPRSTVTSSTKSEASGTHVAKGSSKSPSVKARKRRRYSERT
ncbi:MAG: hypothetical protein FWD97_04475 [Defluviitaleaceae bacterium]|nr:hypothetical protein [Defluviitaleaceae bacterium]